MTTLVTGAGGFIGGQIVQRLLAAGEPVRGLDLRWPPGYPADAELITGSILDRDALDRSVAGASAVIHCAALAGLWTPGRGDHERVNTEGTSRVLEAARSVGVSMVHVSSYTTLIAADTARNAVLDESVEHPPAALLGAYPRSKRLAELIVDAAARDGQDVRTVLPAAPVGAGDHWLTPPTAMLRDLAAERLPALLDCRLNLVDVRAVADAAIAARSSDARGRRYLLAGDDIDLSKLAGLIAAKTGGRAPRWRVPLNMALAAAYVEAGVSGITGRAPTAPLTGVRLAARTVRFDATKARTDLGFAPRALSVCLDEALDWLGSQDHLNV